MMNLSHDRIEVGRSIGPAIPHDYPVKYHIACNCVVNCMAVAHHRFAAPACTLDKAETDLCVVTADRAL